MVPKWGLIVRCCYAVGTWEVKKNLLQTYNVPQLILLLVNRFWAYFTPLIGGKYHRSGRRTVLAHAGVDGFTGYLTALVEAG